MRKAIFAILITSLVIAWLENGQQVRAKYGSRELQAEVATTHLLSALGFGADDVSMARRVRCCGCPHWPMLAPYDGSTFQDARVSDEGRRLLADRLTQLTTPQLTALFANARFDDVAGWVAAFERRVDAIARRPPCP